MAYSVGILTTCGNLLASSGNTDDDTLTPTLVASLEGGPHHADITCAVERVVTAAIGQVDQGLHNCLVLKLIRIDEVGSTELSSPCLLGRVDVHHYDPARLLYFGALDNGQADTAGAENGNVGPLLTISRDCGRAIACGDTASQQAGSVHGDFRLDGYDGYVGNNRVLREG